MGLECMEVSVTWEGGGRRTYGGAGGALGSRERLSWGAMVGEARGASGRREGGGWLNLGRGRRSFNSSPPVDSFEAFRGRVTVSCRPGESRPVRAVYVSQLG